MSYVPTRRAILLARLRRVQSALAKLYATYDDLSGLMLSSSEFDSGDGRQRSTRRKLDEVQDNIDRLEASEMSLINDLYNMGIVSMRLRRRPC